MQVKANRFVTAASLVAAVALAAPAATTAGEPPPPPGSDAAALEAYRESIPTASGKRFVDAARPAPAPLPRTLGERLRTKAPADSHILERISTQQTYGDPPLRTTPQSAPPSSEPTLARAVAGSFAVDDRGITLVAVMVAFALGAVAARSLLRPH